MLRQCYLTQNNLDWMFNAKGSCNTHFMAM